MLGTNVPQEGRSKSNFSHCTIFCFRSGQETWYQTSYRRRPISIAAQYRYWLRHNDVDKILL